MFRGIFKNKMEKVPKDYNPFFARMEEEYQKSTIAIYQAKFNVEEIASLYEKFYDKCLNYINLLDDNLRACFDIEEVFNDLSSFIASVFNKKSISEEELDNIKKIIQEFEETVNAVSIYSNEDDEYYKNVFKYRLRLLESAFCGKTLFKTCKNLYLMIKLINEHYDDLYNVGINHYYSELLKLCYQAEDYGEPIEEDEKLRMLLDVLNREKIIKKEYVFRVVNSKEAFSPEARFAIKEENGETIIEKKLV